MLFTLFYTISNGSSSNPWLKHRCYTHAGPQAVTDSQLRSFSTHTVSIEKLKSVMWKDWAKMNLGWCWRCLETESYYTDEYYQNYTDTETNDLRNIRLVVFAFTAGLLSSFFTFKKREYVFSMFEVVIIRIHSTVFVVVGCFFAILYYSFKNQILITMSETHTFSQCPQNPAKDFPL